MCDSYSEEMFPSYLVDAFTDRRFAGNQAQVCLIDKKLSDAEYQRIAAEFNLSETAFPIPQNGDWRTASSFSLRWFTPKTEVNLCGHATLATAHVIFHRVGNESPCLFFHTLSGELRVERAQGETMRMIFPRFSITSIPLPLSAGEYDSHFTQQEAHPQVALVVECLLGSIAVKSIAYAAAAKKLIVVVDERTTRSALESLSPRVRDMVRVHPEGCFVKGIMVSLAPADPVAQGFTGASGEAYDYVSRYFAPWVGIDEDPATGSAQCALAPFWSPILGKNSLYAYQSCPGRGAQFRVHVKEGEETLAIEGTAVTVLEGQMML